MKTDCPNCSWLLDGDFSPGMNIVCPFCGETFEVCAAPFEQLRKFMETHWPAVEFGPFRDYGYPLKNYTGWIIHRLRENDPAAVIDLMTEFQRDREYSAEKVNTLWTFDFSPYLRAEPETLEEIRALWLRVRFTSHARPESQNIAVLLEDALWTENIELTPYWIGKALELFEEKCTGHNRRSAGTVLPRSCVSRRGTRSHSRTGRSYPRRRRNGPGHSIRRPEGCFPHRSGG